MEFDEIICFLWWSIFVSGWHQTETSFRRHDRTSTAPEWKSVSDEESDGMMRRERSWFDFDVDDDDVVITKNLEIFSRRLSDEEEEEALLFKTENIEFMIVEIRCRFN